MSGRVTRVRHTRFLRNIPIKALASIQTNDLVMWDTANTRAIPGVESTTGLVCLGIAVQGVTDTTNTDTGTTIDVEQGDFLLDNSAAHPIAINPDVANKGIAYVEGPQIVGNTSTGRSAAGPIVGLGWQNLPGAIVRIES